MGRALRPGEEVSWNTSRGTTHGREMKNTTAPDLIEDHKIAATNPEYVAESSKSGKRAAHKRSVLKKS